MKMKSSRTLLAAVVVSLLALGIPNLADANSRNREKKLDKAAKRELRKDHSELQRDRQDLSRLYRSGASREDIYRKRAEIRDDLREIAQDRRQLYGRYNDYRGDRYGYGSGSYGRYDNGGWWGRNHSNGWNLRNSSWRDRDRSRWDYHHD
jgi:hypothetical protein